MTLGAWSAGRPYGVFKCIFLSILFFVLHSVNKYWVKFSSKNHKESQLKLKWLKENNAKENTLFLTPSARSPTFMCFRNMALEMQQIFLIPSVFSCRRHSLEFPFPKSLTGHSGSCLSMWRVSKPSQEMWIQPLSKSYFSGSHERDFYLASHSPPAHWSSYRTQIKWGFHGPCT